MDDFAALIGEATGMPHVATFISVEQFPVTFRGFPGARDMAALFEFYNEVDPVRDMALTRTLNPSTANFRDWAQKNKDTLIKKRT